MLTFEFTGSVVSEKKDNYYGIFTTILNLNCKIENNTNGMKQNKKITQTQSVDE
jgi:hypothetical protein